MTEPGFQARAPFLFVLWTAVNRLSREGEVIDPDERVSALEALKALTINPAYWYREENTKGLLEVGKLADFVILDKNPLTVDPRTIKDLKVLETIKEGRRIYTATGNDFPGGNQSLTETIPR